MNLPTIPPPPTAPCSLQEFEAYARNVIEILKPHAASFLVKLGSVEIMIFELPPPTLGSFTFHPGGKNRIVLSREFAEWSCAHNTAFLQDDLLHECAHMLSPVGEGHGVYWRRVARALGATPKARNCYPRPEADSEYIVRHSETHKIYGYYAEPPKIDATSYLKGKKRETLGKLEVVKLEKNAKK